MKASNVIDVAAAIVTVALVTVLVTHAQTAKIIGATGSAFAGSIRAAQGR